MSCCGSGQHPPWPHKVNTCSPQQLTKTLKWLCSVLGQVDKERHVGVGSAWGCNGAGLGHKSETPSTPCPCHRHWFLGQKPAGSGSQFRPWSHAVITQQFPGSLETGWDSYGWGVQPDGWGHGQVGSRTGRWSRGWDFEVLTVGLGQSHHLFPTHPCQQNQCLLQGCTGSRPWLCPRPQPRAVTTSLRSCPGIPAPSHLPSHGPCLHGSHPWWWVQGADRLGALAAGAASGRAAAAASRK